MASELTLRQYDPRDAHAVWELHEWAMRVAGTDPADVPGTDDLRAIETQYLDAGGAFLVGIGDGEDDSDAAVPETFDGPVVAMGGLLPSESGHDDERTVPGAAELHRMRVAPPMQGRGHGRDLLAALERRAAQLGFETLLATTAVRQEAAARFYPAAGYREVDRSVQGEYELIHFEKTL
ncbi:GNAT family N-acetyltransferase [Halomicrobium sp. LC1Hm]|uniref:GNAT family N-acetyltransferase n=1 Tax=Halomicrobium sp. LC1Hm TaxID=2610902 RepID=UPI0012982DB5|nr:GNAT family N-acetyltransferase [Halomicrobium sp. LC1Hm]QGA84138.1 GCN5-related N-acetyltransferase [Halomicrobium sp. LC1Hm]